MWQIINNIHEYLINVVRKHLALISALQLMMSGANKGLVGCKGEEKAALTGSGQEYFMLLLLPKILGHQTQPLRLALDFCVSAWSV